MVVSVLDWIAGELLDAIKRDFGSVDAFRNLMTTKTVAIQGSGWGWLVRPLNYLPIK